MPSQTVVIKNKRGLHARAAAKFVKTANQFQAAIYVSKNNVSVSGHSIMGLMMLSASPNTSITILAEGADADQALQNLCDLVDRKFDED